ncbi:MAG: two-component regulator propeller domain-containing protein [Limisphaerales bacterium]
MAGGSIFFGIVFSAATLTAAESEKDDAYFARVWTAEDGLPENKVVGLAQASDGYLWVATQGGVVRFDGARFQPFEAASSTGYASSTMRVLLLDREGRLWIAKEGGVVVCVDGTQVRAFTSKDGLPQFEGQRSMAEDDEGNLWISYTKGTVVRLNKAGQVDAFTSKNGLPSTGVCVLTSDRNGRLWFAKNGRIGFFRDGKFVILLNLSPHFISVAPARAGGIWICSGSRVMKFNEGAEPVTLGELPPAQTITEPTALFEDREGAVWVGTATDGLFRCDTNGVTSVHTSYPVISSLAEDREGNLWVGTRGGGLDRVQRRVVSLIGAAAGLPFEGVQSICQDAAGVLWVVEQNGVLVRRQDDRWIIPSGKEVPAVHAMSVVADSKGTVWIGANRGALYQWKDGQFQSLNLGDEIPKGGVRSLLATASGDLWIATDVPDTNNALYRLHNGNIQKFDLPPGYRFIRAMAEDAAGNFWAGASDGLLVRVTGDTLVDETAKFPRFSIRCLHATPDGSLWIGYAGFGAGRLRDGRITRFSTEQGLPNDYVSQILADGRGGIWFAGNQGIFQVREQEFDDVAAGRAARVQPVIYGRSQGLANLQANFDYYPNALRSADGSLYFSMLTGLAEVRPERTRLNRLPPVVLIERVIGDERTFAIYQNGGSTNQIPAPVELKNAGDKIKVWLPPGLQHVQVEFSALSFIAPENVQFRYQMEGLDQGWVDAGTRRAVQYNHLAPGKYHFKVIACNNDGIWNETGASLAIIVEPQIWETLWFKVLVSAATFTILCGIVVITLRRRHRFQIQHLEQQHALEHERTRIARDLHDDLGVGLTEIGLLGDLAGAPASAPETSREYLHEITGRARDLVALLDEIVWAINPANDTSQSLGDYFFKYAQTLLNRASIRCRLEVVEPFPNYGLNAEERHQLFLAFKEALNNVIRHSGATEVRISLGATAENLTIKIADNGHGVEVSAAESSRDGLIGMQKRLQRLGGRCEVTSAAESGTCVTLCIPVGQQKEL